MGRRPSSSLLAAAALCLLAGAAGYTIETVTEPVMMGESPFWCDETQTITFVDIIGKKVLRYNPAFPDELKSISFDGRVSPAVPVRGSNSSKLMVGVGRTVRLVDVDWGRWGVGEPAAVRSQVYMAEVEKGMPGNRFNDGKADRNGRLWIGTMDDRQTSRRRRDVTNPNKGELFRFDLHDSLVGGKARVASTLVVEDELRIPNGMAWTADDKVFYLADSAARVIYRFDFLAAEGKLANRTTAFCFDDYIPGAGVPDGITLDLEGNLWVAVVHGGTVIRVDPRTGKLLQTINMNTTSVSAVEWGGRDRDVLYVTTARYKMDAAQLAREPNAGRMFAIRGLGTRGLPGMPYPALSSSWRLSVQWIVPALAFLLSSRGLTNHLASF